jgi:hypothetical protein
MHPETARLNHPALAATLLGLWLAAGSARSVAAPAVPEVALKRVNLLVRDMQRSLAKLRAARLDVVEPRRSKTAEGDEFTELAFTDPDGHLVVLYQLD